jgi:fused signal recognition particle receptor
MGIFGFFNKEKKETLDKGLEKTKSSVFDKLARAVAGKSKVDDDVLDNLEEVLITSDVGVDTTLKIIERIEERVARDKYVSTSELNSILKDENGKTITSVNDVKCGANIVSELKDGIIVSTVKEVENGKHDS